MERVIENVKVGDILVDHIDEEGKAVEMVVTDVYKHCVIAVKKNGIKRGISYGELVQRGKEPSYGCFYTTSKIQRTDYELEESEC